MSIEHLLARLTAQTSWREPRVAPGGAPEFTAADISLIASHAPHISFHALMAKCCQEQQSIQELGDWTFNLSVNEWFYNPACEGIRFEARQLKKLVALAVVGWLDPQIEQARNLETRAAWIGANAETYRRNFQAHYSYLTGELDYVMAIGRRAIYGFKRDDVASGSG